MIDLNELLCVLICDVFVVFAIIVEQAEAILVAIVQQSVEFAVCYLETFGCNDDDHGIQVCFCYILYRPSLNELFFLRSYGFSYVSPLQFIKIRRVV